MLPNDRAQPAAPDKPSWGNRAMQTYRRLPFWLKVVAAIAAIPLAGPIILAALVYGVVAVVQGRRSAGLARRAGPYRLAASRFLAPMSLPPSRPRALEPVSEPRPACVARTRLPDSRMSLYSA